MNKFCSWLGLCPNWKKTGGRVKSSRTRRGGNRVAQALRLAAQSLHHSQVALGGFLRRMKGRLGGTIAAALNGVFPLLAFVIPPEERQFKLEFADCPELGATFEQLGYKVLPAVELARPLTREMWQGLGPHEQKDVLYFRPRRVGDVIYNYWD